MKKTTPISEFEVNTDVQGFFLCTEKNLRTTRAGEPYLDLKLRDRTGTISGKVWDRVDEFTRKFEPGDPVAVKGRVESFQDRPQLIVDGINKAAPERYRRYGFREEMLIRASPREPAQMWSDVGGIIRKMNNRYLKKLVTKLYQKHKKALMTHPASLSLHYPYRSGYLEHVSSMANAGLVLARHYGVDGDLLLAGIFLHGIGKIREVSDTLVPGYTDEGHFLGHTMLGRDMVREAAAEIRGFPPELLTRLEHLIVCHEGSYDRRSVVKARTKEALLLQLLDNMDARLNVFDNIVSEDSDEGVWTSRRNVFGVSVYKGKSRGDS
ncbi:MAG: 3'-5' exoribonuclease YhaM family protein [Fidelibacterota bacterium]